MSNQIDEASGVAPVAGDTVHADRPHRKLRGTLGVWGIVFLVVAAASPLGVIGGPVPLGIAGGSGVGFPAIFVVSTVIILLFAVGFTALTPYVPDAGAFYSYIGKGLGRVTGFGFAFVALISYLALEIAVYGLIGQGAQALFASYGLPQIHWGIWALAAFAVVTALGHFNIDLSRNVLGVLLIAEVAIVLALDAVVVFTGGHEGLSTGFLHPAQIVSVNYFGAMAVLDGLFDALRAGHQPAAVMIASAGAVHVLRDPTRGGLGTTLNEIAGQSGVGLLLDEAAIPVQPQVEAACELLADHRWLIATPQPTTTQGGRPTSVYRLNPLAKNSELSPG